MNSRQLNSVSYPISFFMASSADHVTGVTGLTPTVSIRKVGGAFAAPAGTVSEVGKGWYEIAAHATDRNTLGELLVNAEAPGCDTFDGRYEVVNWNPFAVQDAILSDGVKIAGNDILTIKTRALLIPVAGAASAADWTPARAVKLDDVHAALQDNDTSITGKILRYFINRMRQITDGGKTYIVVFKDNNTAELFRMETLRPDAVTPVELSGASPAHRNKNEAA